MRQWRWRAVVLAFVLGYSLDRAVGQAVYGSIVGTVVDVGGGAVPGAKVTILNTGQGVSFTTTTNESGNYEQTHLIVGAYDVKVEKQGFQTSVQRNVRVSVDAVTQVNATLQVGAVTETVNVTAEVPLLKTQRADVSYAFSQKAVTELPILDRDVNRVYMLAPGVQATGFTAASEQPHDVFRPRVNGQYWGGIAFQLDGTDNRESVLAEPVIAPNLDAIAEMKVTTVGYDAEFGQADQAVISFQTKSGTNDLHGSTFWFRRDNSLTARNPFTQFQPIPGAGNRFIPATLWNQFGGSLGGPIRKDKTFIFGDYQGTRQRDGESNLVRVPTQAERNGDLSGLGVNIYNPYMDPTCATRIDVPSVASRVQFPGNVIPSSCLSPQAQFLLKSMPFANVPGATGAALNYAASGTGIKNGDAFDVRVDQYQSERLHLFGRYSFQRYDLLSPGAYGFQAGGLSFPSFPFSGQSSLRNQSVAYGFDYNFGPRWLTDFRFGFFRYRVFVDPNGLGTTPAKDAGIPGLNLDSVTSGMPAFFINGTNGENSAPSATLGAFAFGYALPINQCNCPLNEQEDEFQFVSNWTRISGNHSIKFGSDFRYHLNLRVPSDNHRSGQLNFNTIRTAGPGGSGLGLASFLLGDVSSMIRYVSSATDAAERQKRWFAYAQDTWRVIPRLTLNFGLRWEDYFPQYVNGTAKGGFVSLATGEVLVAGQNDVSLNGNVRNTATHFEPRLGVAYQATPRTVIRVGYGRSFDVGVFGTSFGHNVTQNLPVLAIQQLNPASNFLTVFTLAQGPSSVDPTTILSTQPVGPAGNHILPDKVTPNVLPLTSDRQMRLPSVDSWNVTLERQLTPTVVTSVAYVANKGTHFTPGGTNYNANNPTVVGFSPCTTSPPPCGLSTDQRRPFFQRFGWTQPIKYFSDDANNNFNSLQAKVEKRFSNGLLLQANYTWAHAFDYDTDYFFINPNIDYGPQSNIRNEYLVISQVYELPFGKGKHFLSGASRKLDYLVGGWQLSSNWTLGSGLPFTPTYQGCGSDRDTGPCRVTKVGEASVANPSPSQWFLTTGGVALANGQTIGPWQRPQKGTFGLVGRNSFHGPHFFDTDMSFYKNFSITEKLKGQFRAESYNIFNHVNPGQPDSCVDCTTGGRIFALFPLALMRQWQFGLRFEF